MDWNGNEPEWNNNSGSNLLANIKVSTISTSSRPSTTAWPKKSPGANILQLDGTVDSSETETEADVEPVKCRRCRRSYRTWQSFNNHIAMCVELLSSSSSTSSNNSNSSISNSSPEESEEELEMKMEVKQEIVPVVPLQPKLEPGINPVCLIDSTFLSNNSSVNNNCNNNNNNKDDGGNDNSILSSTNEFACRKPEVKARKRRPIKSNGSIRTPPRPLAVRPSLPVSHPIQLPESIHSGMQQVTLQAGPPPPPPPLFLELNPQFSIQQQQQQQQQIYIIPPQSLDQTFLPSTLGYASIPNLTTAPVMHYPIGAFPSIHPSMLSTGLTGLPGLGVVNVNFPTLTNRIVVLPQQHQLVSFNQHPPLPPPRPPPPPVIPVPPPPNIYRGNTGIIIPLPTPLPTPLPILQTFQSPPDAQEDREDATRVNTSVGAAFSALVESCLSPCSGIALPLIENEGKTADAKAEADNKPDKPVKEVIKPDEPDSVDAAEMINEDVVAPPLRCSSPQTEEDQRSFPKLMDGADLLIF